VIGGRLMVRTNTELYEKFLIGSSTHMQTLEIASIEQIDAILNLLKECTPTCLAKLECVSFYYRPETEEEDLKNVQVMCSLDFYTQL
jgi:hypothetical protein